MRGITSKEPDANDIYHGDHLKINSFYYND
jgi:hypothetical protein